jgi:phospholipid transport system transporter-binding protein
MSAARIVARGEAGFGVEGVLDFTTVARLAAQGERMFKGAGRVEIDLQGVRSANSAGIALLLEWLDLARRRGVSLRYRNIPESLASLAGLANLSGLIPVVRDGA